MANEISTAGITIKYAVEATAGTRPLTGFTAIPNIKSISGLNAEPGSLDVTDLGDTVYKRYIGALKDVGGNVSLTANITSAFKTAWSTLVSAAETAFASGKTTWFEIAIPNWTDSFFFAGTPAELGFADIDVDSVFEGDVFIAPNQITGWAAKST